MIRFNDSRYIGLETKQLWWYWWWWQGQRERETKSLLDWGLYIIYVWYKKILHCSFCVINDVTHAPFKAAIFSINLG